VRHDMNDLYAELVKSADVDDLHRCLRVVECSCQEIEKAIKASEKAQPGTFENALWTYLNASRSYWMGSAVEFEAIAEDLNQWRQGPGPDLRARYLAGRGYCHLARHFFRQGNLSQADKFAQESLVLAKSIGSRHLKGEAWATYSLTETAHCRWDAALSAAATAGEYFERIPQDVRGLALSREAAGRAHFDGGNFDRAHEEFEAAMRLLQASPCEYGQVEIQLLRAHICYQTRDFRRHNLLVKEAEGLSEILQYQRGLARAKRYRGKVLLRDGKADSARGLFKESLAICEQVGDPAGCAKSHLSLARACADERNWEQALTHYREAERIFCRQGDFVRTAVAQFTTGLVLAKQDMATKEQAAAAFTEALGTLQDLCLARDKRQLRDILLAAGWAAKHGEWDDARKEFRGADVRSDMRDIVDHGGGEAVQKAKKALADAQDISLRGEAQKLFEQALATYRETRDRRHAASALSEMAGQYRDWGDYQKAAACLKEAIGLASDMHAERLAAGLDLEQSLTVRAGELARTAVDAKEQEKLRLILLDNTLHDIFSPLVSVPMALDALLARRVPQDKQGKRLKQIRLKVDYVTTMARGVLDVRKAEGGRMVIGCKNVKLKALADEAIEIVKPIPIDDKDDHCVAGERFRNAIGEDIEVWGDDVRLKQVLVNLLDNADRHTFKHEGNWIELSAIVPKTGEEAPMIQVTVRDTGAGIPPELKGILFKLYGAASHDRATKEAARGAERQHYGIGLECCRRVVESHGGEIWIDEELTRWKPDNQDDKKPGTVIHFTLPIPPADDKGSKGG